MRAQGQRVPPRLFTSSLYLNSVHEHIKKTGIDTSPTAMQAWRKSHEEGTSSSAPAPKRPIEPADEGPRQSPRKLGPPAQEGPPSDEDEAASSDEVGESPTAKPTS